jgi:hypothetical protein
VQGYIQEIAFKESSVVKEGDLGALPHRTAPIGLNSEIASGLHRFLCAIDFR